MIGFETEAWRLSLRTDADLASGLEWDRLAGGCVVGGAGGVYRRDANRLTDGSEIPVGAGVV